MMHLTFSLRPSLQPSLRLWVAVCSAAASGARQRFDPGTIGGGGNLERNQSNRVLLSIAQGRRSLMVAST